MKKQLILITTGAVALTGCGFAESGMWLPSLACFGWLAFVLWANTRRRKKPRAATRGKRTRGESRSISNDTTVTLKTQMKFWTPAGKVILPVHYEL